MFGETLAQLIVVFFQLLILVRQLDLESSDKDQVDKALVNFMTKMFKELTMGFLKIVDIVMRHMRERYSTCGRAEIPAADLKTCRDEEDSDDEDSYDESRDERVTHEGSEKENLTNEDVIEEIGEDEALDDPNPIESDKCHGRNTTVQPPPPIVPAIVPPRLKRKFIEIANNNPYSRHAECKNCGEEFNRTTNEEGACLRHPGTHLTKLITSLANMSTGRKAYRHDNTFWAKHGITRQWLTYSTNYVQNRKAFEARFADGFKWTCCDRPSKGRPCLKAKHEAAALPNKRLRIVQGGSRNSRLLTLEPIVSFTNR